MHAAFMPGKKPIPSNPVSLVDIDWTISAKLKACANEYVHLFLAFFVDEDLHCPCVLLATSNRYSETLHTEGT